MSHTHLLYHIVFATKNRMPIIKPEWQSELHRYLGGIVKNFEGVPIEINGIEDHVHLLVRLKPKYSISGFLQELKADSSKWTKRNHFAKFSWQVRYAAFTVSESQFEKVRKYIQQQQEHHRRIHFTDEYIELLKAHRVEYDEKYLWN
jgi:REP element-mobilizing transposase RayT